MADMEFSFCPIDAGSLVASHLYVLETVIRPVPLLPLSLGHRERERGQWMPPEAACLDSWTLEDWNQKGQPAGCSMGSLETYYRVQSIDERKQ
jgi:hypothetical protein